ncbi:MAG: GtrA family protein [Eubacteriales bacterium]|nr:GtrA family protein [Eubacteriales bacterium]
MLIRLFGSSAWAAYRIAVAKDAAAASALSRFGSGILNFTLNRNWSFQSKGRVRTEAVRYLVLFGANLFCNASAVGWLTLKGVPAALGKFMVDVLLFLINYQVQKRWVFK